MTNEEAFTEPLRALIELLARQAVDDFLMEGYRGMPDERTVVNKRLGPDVAPR